MRDGESASPAATQLIVLSMHRSGSSALMAMLETMGAHVGEKDDLLAPSLTNPRGFWERKDLHDACRSIMRARGASWWQVSALGNRPDPWHLSDEEASLLQNVFGKLGTRPVVAIKEPMLCLAMPAILPFLNNPSAIFIVRHPLEIARSLERRNGFSLDFGLALWEVYISHALGHAARMPTLFVSHRTLMTDPCAVAASLIVGIRATGLRALSEAEVDAIIDPGLNHHVVPHDDIGALTPSQAALWRSLELLSGQPHDSYSLMPGNLKALERTEKLRKIAARDATG